MSYAQFGEYLKNDVDLQWVLAKKCQNAHTFDKLFLWFDNKVIEYIINCDKVDPTPHLSKLVDRLNMDMLQSIMVKYPKSIEKACHYKIPITLDMAIAACKQKDFIYDIKTGRKLFKLILKNPVLHCNAHIFLKSSYLDWPVSFRECAIFFCGACETDLLSILEKLRRANHWLLFQCFYMACYSISTYRLLSNWRQNVSMLSDITEFDTRAMALVLSFDNLSGTKKYNNFFSLDY